VLRKPGNNFEKICNFEKVHTGRLFVLKVVSIWNYELSRAFQESRALNQKSFWRWKAAYFFYVYFRSIKLNCQQHYATENGKD